MDNLHKYEKFLPLAKKMALKSAHKYRHSSLLIKRNRIIDIGINQEKTHSKAPAYYSDKNRRLHSEAHAILGNKLEDLKGTTILNVRVDNDGKLKLSKPCHVCLPLIQAAGIKHIIYTTNDGVLEGFTL